MLLLQADLVLIARLVTSVQQLGQQPLKFALMVPIQMLCGKAAVQFVKVACHVLARQIVHSAKEDIIALVEK